MDLIYAAGEVYWMTGVLVVGIVYGIFAFVYSRGKK